MKGVIIRKAPIVSPIQKVDEIFSLVGELKRLKIVLESSITDAESHLERAQSIQKGNPGKDGRHGVSPDPEAIATAVLRKIRQPKDGESPTVDYEEVMHRVARLMPKAERGLNGKDGKSVSIEEVLEAVKKNIKLEHIPGLKNEIDSYRNQLAGKIYGKDTWARGGGDTVIAGAGVSIVNVNGQKVISASGSSGTPVWGEILQTQSPTGTVFNLDFTPITGSVRVFRGGSYQSVGNGDYTISEGAITLSTALQNGETLTADYSH